MTAAPSPACLAALHAACFTTPRPWSEAEFSALLTGGCFRVGTCDGFALGRVVAGEAELLTLAVAPLQRRKGLGRTLLDLFEAEARAQGSETAFLEVAADNHAALALYRGAGFTPAGRRKGYYQTPDGARIDALILLKHLGPPAPAGN